MISNSKKITKVATTLKKTEKVATTPKRTKQVATTPKKTKQGYQGKKKRFVKQKRYKPKGIVFIQTTQNNTIVTLTDLKGNTKSWASGGSCGFNGSRRKTPYAAKAAAEKVAKDAISLGLRFINVKMKGLRRGKKKSAVKGLVGLKIIKIHDITGIPHNGCRAPKKRRT